MSGGNRVGQRERRFGMEEGDYDWLDRIGDGKCWICKQSETVANRRLAIDHDHTTGTVRGLLCTRCNQVLGRMNDDPVLLRAAAEYLEQAHSAFSDGCEKCMAANCQDWMFPPVRIVNSDGAWTLFAYRCPRGHRWTCGWRTRGVPTVWSM